MTNVWQTSVGAVAMACISAAALAQTPAPAARGGGASTGAPAGKPAAGEVASEPIRCWWKTDRTAIRVGERFQLVLTCAVIETTGVTVVPAVNQLEAGAISLTPFEAVSGIRREDVVVPPWRYLQYEYAMRLLSEGFFGQDVNIPSLTVTYNLQAAGAGSEGRDQTYLLPALPMRVLSLVPRAAGDIRDASGQTFAAVESRRFRATAAVVGAGIAFAFAAVLAALALGREVTQEYVDAAAPERQGQLAVRTGLFRRRRALLSAATTSSAITTRLGGTGVSGAQARVNLEQISGAMQLFSAATYGRPADADAPALNSALDDAIAAIRRLRLRSFWPMRAAL